jgi:hypothetical protein
MPGQFSSQEKWFAPDLTAQAGPGASGQHVPICYDASVRTTVTLDPDVAAKLKKVARERGISFKQALNQAIRAGLEGGRGPRRRFRQYTQPMGLRPGVSIDKAMQLAAMLEDEEATRELEVRK